MAKNFMFSDDPVVHKGKRYYLRTKFGRRGSECTFSIRTQMRGKGKLMTRVSGVVKDDLSQIKLINKLKRKFDFQYLMLVDVPPVPKAVRDE